MKSETPSRDDEESVGVPERRWPAARVLVAEDDQELRWLITRTLKKNGFEVVEAKDGSALLDCAGEILLENHTLSGLDVIISDIRMPGFSGLDVLAGLKHAGVRVPVVLITAFGDDFTHEQAKRLGAAAIVDKPFDMDELCDIVLEKVQWHKRSSEPSNVNPDDDNGTPDAAD